MYAVRRIFLVLCFLALPAAALPASDRSTEVLRYGCANELGRREVTLFANGTVRLRDGLPGEEGKDWMGLAELSPEELQGAVRRLEEEDLSEVRQLPEGVTGMWVERCTLALQLPGGDLKVYRFGRYDALPLTLSRVVRVAEDLAARVADVRGQEELPVDYEPQPEDVLRRRDGELFRVIAFTTDKRGVELQGIDVPLTVYVPRDQMRREFVALIERPR
jgi:hypothetical protein